MDPSVSLTPGSIFHDDPPSIVVLPPVYGLPAEVSVIFSLIEDGRAVAEAFAHHTAGIKTAMKTRPSRS
jgi:hypothetical protein